MKSQLSFHSEKNLIENTPKNHTIFRLQITNLIGCCKKPKSDVIPGKRASFFQERIKLFAAPRQ